MFCGTEINIFANNYHFLIQISLLELDFSSKSGGGGHTTSAKRARMDMDSRSEFEMEVQILSDWLDKTETNLELISSDEATGSSLTLEEQLVLIRVSCLAIFLG